jgi:seryl-tRNA synthetase
MKMDPRVKASSADLMKQFELSKLLYETRRTLQPIGKGYESLVGELAKAKEKAGDKPVKEPIEALTKKLQEFADPARVRAGQSLELDVLSKVEKLFGDLQEGDAAPTSQAEAAALDLQRNAKSAAERWRALAPDVAALNSALATARLEKIKAP